MACPRRRLGVQVACCADERGVHPPGRGRARLPLAEACAAKIRGVGTPVAAAVVLFETLSGPRERHRGCRASELFWWTFGRDAAAQWRAPR